MIIADTGFWLALANRDDKHHYQAQIVIRSINEPLITTILGHGRILTSDRQDFSIYRWNENKTFENLFLEYP